VRETVLFVDRRAMTVSFEVMIFGGALVLPVLAAATAVADYVQDRWQVRVR
jgi:hypothetical protein